MKFPFSKIIQENLPYYALWLLLFLFILIFLLSLLLNKGGIQPAYPTSQYVQGYYINSAVLGSIRIIPLAGPEFKSPVSSPEKALNSPYLEYENGDMQTIQKF